MQCCFIGKGIVYARKKGVAEALRSLGNVTSLVLDVTEDVKETKDFTKSGGGTDCQVRRVQKIEATIVMNCFNADNWALATLGTKTNVVGNSVTNEVVTAYKDGFVPLDKVGPYSGLVVTNTAGSTTYVLDTDYTVQKGGIFILAAGAITDGQVLHVDYTWLAQQRIEGNTQATPLMEFVFDGLNEAENDKPVRLTAYKVKFGPAAQLSFISDEFGNLTIKGELLKDTAITGGGLSQYYKVQIAD
jgi:hypothetical protein